MLGQRASLVELREANRHTAANSRIAIACRCRAEVQALGARSLPRQNLRTLLCHKHAVAIGQGPAPASVALKGISP